MTRPPKAALLRLDANEGRSVLEVQALGAAGLAALEEDALSRYTAATALEVGLAEYVGARAEQVLVTTGADDAIDRICRAWLGKDRELVVATPTFGMIPEYARMCGARVHAIEDSWGPAPVERLLEAIDERTGVLAVVSPNNPTGAVTAPKDMLRLARALPPQAVLMVDGAYVEFADADPTSALIDAPNVLVVRTLSKAWGLAGLRVGYVVGAADRIERLRDFGGPYPVAGPSLALACDAVGARRERLRVRMSTNRSLRDRLTELLRDLDCDPLPSQANFVFARLGGRDRSEWARCGLLTLDVRVRGFADVEDGLRITVPRDDAEFDQLEQSLRTTLAPEALLFDMDGVLADVSTSYRRAIVTTCASFGVAVSAEEIDSAKARGSANDDWELTHRLIRDGGVSVEYADVVAAFEAAYQGSPSSPGFRDTETLIPDRGRLLALRGSRPLGVVTGRPRADADRFLADFGLDELFSVIIAREDAPPKPSPEPIVLALERLGVETAWMFGDTPDDLEAARAAAVLPVGIRSPGQSPVLTRALAEGAAAVLDDPTRIEAILR